MTASMGVPATVLAQAAPGSPLVGVAPWVWAMLCGLAAAILLLPPGRRIGRMAGAVLGVGSLALLFGQVLSPLVDGSQQAVFWSLSGVVLIAAAAAISARDPVYTAIWFALSLLGTAGLLFYQGAQFLAVATVAVYAGAIVVTFLFVLMLAQPEGRASYDRVSWGWYAKSVSAIVSALLLGVVSFAVHVACAAEGVTTAASAPRGVLAPSHMARFGAELFSRHLLSVEITGTLLLIALVGALAIMIQSGHLDGEMREGALHD